MNEDNKLIAEFMGEREVCTGMYRLEQHQYLERIPYSYQCEEVDDFELDEMKYNSSWDWLIPVVDRLDDALHNNLTDISDIISISEGLLDSLKSCNIKIVYKCVVDTLKWYNEQEKK